MYLFLFFLQLSHLTIAQKNSRIDSLLINWEKLKWEALSKGQFGLHNEWFAQDFSSIGYMPDGSVYRAEKRNVSKPTNELEKAKLPAADFALSNFKVVTASSEVKIVTYQADGPLNIYVTTTWVKRNNKWLTVFYQATKYM